MSDTKQPVPQTNGPMDVSESLDTFGNPKFTVKSDKFNVTFEAVKEFSGYAFYRIKVSKGSLPQELTGRYTNHERALEALRLHILRAKPSRSVKRDMNTAAREKQKKNASAAKPDNKEHIQ